MPRSSPRVRRRREAELPRFAARIEERGEKGDTTRGEKRGDSPASPDPARLRRREPPDHTALTRPRPRLAGVAYRDARSRGLAPRAAVSKEKTRRHDKAADRRQVRPTITTDRRVTKNSHRDVRRSTAHAERRASAARAPRGAGARGRARFLARRGLMARCAWRQEEEARSLFYLPSGSRRTRVSRCWTRVAQGVLGRHWH